MAHEAILPVQSRWLLDEGLRPSGEYLDDAGRPIEVTAHPERQGLEYEVVAVSYGEGDLASTVTLRRAGTEVTTALAGLRQHAERRRLVRSSAERPSEPLPPAEGVMTAQGWFCAEVGRQPYVEGDRVALVGADGCELLVALDAVEKTVQAELELLWRGHRLWVLERALGAEMRSLLPDALGSVRRQPRPCGSPRRPARPSATPRRGTEGLTSRKE